MFVSVLHVKFAFLSLETTTSEKFAFKDLIPTVVAGTLWDDLTDGVWLQSKLFGIICPCLFGTYLSGKSISVWEEITFI